MDNDIRQNEDTQPEENSEVKVDELEKEDLEDVSGGGDNSGCNCNCGIE